MIKTTQPLKSANSFKITDSEYKMLADYIQTYYGIDLKEGKRALISGRLFGLLDQLGFTNFSDYYKYLIKDKNGEAVKTLVDRVTTNHTFFMREAGHFKYFRDVVLPNLTDKIPDKDLRIWCAACSTGEEAYTLAMLVDDCLKEKKALWDSQILATDISSRVLKAAIRGVYSKENISPLPPHWKLSYFKRFGEGEYCVIDRIKKEVIYRNFNLMEKFYPFKKKFHCIFCRNVMIYFDEQTKNELINKLYEYTEPGGYLFIGHSESISRKESKYKYIMPAVYRKE